MLQTDHKLEQDIQRSIDRLKIVIQEVSAVNSIPAFYYSVIPTPHRPLSSITMPKSMDLKPADLTFLSNSKLLSSSLANKTSAKL